MKSGVVTIDAAGALTYTDGPGVLQMHIDALTTVISTTKAPVGFTALLQRGLLVTAGNMVGIHSGTGRFGLGVAGKNIYFGR